MEATMEKRWNRKRSKQISLRVTPERYESFDKYCKLEELKKQELLEEYLADLFKIIDKRLEGEDK